MSQRAGTALAGDFSIGRFGAFDAPTGGGLRPIANGLDFFYLGDYGTRQDRAAKGGRQEGGCMRRSFVRHPGVPAPASTISEER